MAKINNYNELYRFMEETNEIGDDEIAILRELDETNSMVTQASLNDILVGVYKRLESEKISVSEIGESVSREDFASWVEDTFDGYTAGLFKESTGSH